MKMVRVVIDQNQINNFVEQVLRENTDEVEKYRSGKTKVFGFLMGQLMKLAQGKIDPKTANDLMMKALNSEDN